MPKLFLTDCDEVILNWYLGLSEYLAKHYPEYKLNLAEYSMGLPPEFSKKVIDEFNTSPNFAEIPALRDSLEYVQKIKDLDYKFVGITTCLGNDYTRIMREYNLRTLFGNDTFEDIHCLPIGTSKLPILEKYESTFWVDDKLKHCESGAEAGHKSFQMIHEYNINDNRPAHITPVQNWKEIYEYIISN